MRVIDIIKSKSICLNSLDDSIVINMQQYRGQVMLQRSKQQILQKLSPNRFIALKQYPNRQLLSKSKVVKFNSHYKCFDERARIFIESCYLLIRAQIQKTLVYVSTNIFANFYMSVFMMYSFDCQYKEKMKVIKPGNLIKEIVAIFDVIFNNTRNILQIQMQETEENLGDFQKLKILQNVVDLIKDLEKEARKQIKDYYYYVGNDVFPWNPNRLFEPSNIAVILLKLQNSLLFQQYSFHLKCEHGQFIRALLSIQSLTSSYQQLIQQNVKLFKSMTDKHPSNNPTQMIMIYQGKFIWICKYLMKQKYISFQSKSEDEEDTNNQGLLLQIKFQTNLRKYSHESLTSNESSSQEMNSNYSEILNLDQMNVCKNTIEFHIKIKAEDAKIKLQESKIFVINIVATCKWRISEIYFVEINKIWNQVLSTWENFIYERDDLFLEKNRPFKFQLCRQKMQNDEEEKVRMKTAITIEMNPNLTNEVFLAVDRMVTLFLLFENIFKNMTRFSRYYTDNYDNYIKKIYSSAYLEDMISQLKYASLDQERYFTSLVRVVKLIVEK